VAILRPDLLDYEQQQRFEVLLEVHDLFEPENERRSVRYYINEIPQQKGSCGFSVTKILWHCV